ncbi:piggyBac transposable element-derived protein 4-like [Nymphalis io]|uniref:piggyBac transposable element-derived protein 4-like n=1 Tax=Inachis io TaxID=171585 RepID=UPI0021689359|nr:piggyBac transposable element-derived protein 4-like [Nymphalis io]
MPLKLLSDEQMRRILEDSDGEDEFSRQLEDLDSHDEDDLESGTYVYNAQDIPMLSVDEDLISIQQFIDITNTPNVNAAIAQSGNITASASDNDELECHPARSLSQPNEVNAGSSGLPADALQMSAADDLHMSPADSIFSTPHIPQLSTEWQSEIRSLPRQVFTGYDEGKRQERLFSDQSDLWTIFTHIFDEDIIEFMVVETNRYALQTTVNDLRPNSRLRRWKPITGDEMRKFLGVYLLTGVINFPMLENYWKKDKLYYHPLLHEINMSYNKFALILKCWHFVDNEAPRNEGDRLYKIQPLIDKLTKNWRKIFTPGERIVVDESMVGFRGRIKFRTYNPQKSHKYGIKIYKLCTDSGYTWSYRVYSGQDDQITGLDKPGSVVVSLCTDLLKEGRIMITDNYYTSIPLARYLKEQGTDLCGTIRKNRRELPQEVVQQRLEKGQISVQQNNFATILKWHDKRDVLMLSTCHNHEMQMM